ncbi:MAG: glutathione peroxidase [Metamycoplasmataceae bacterium]
MTIYDFKMENISKEVVDFSKYKGKVMLIVNVASKCGFAKQYKGLEKLYKNYKDQGLVILGFPCTQFMNQELETDEEVKNFCTLTYNVTFEMFSRIDVKGEKQSPLYKFLTKEMPHENCIYKFLMKFKKLQKKFKSDDVMWNFEKFLINKEGKVVKRFASTKKPEKIEKYIKNLL